MSLFWNFGRMAGDASQAWEASARAVVKAEQFSQRLKDVEERLERMSLACQALWEIAKERLELEEEDVYKKMQEVDMRDGKQDNKISTRILNCPKCKRVNNTTRLSCMYCGLRLGKKHVFE